jgi:hypothetical protein
MNDKLTTLLMIFFIGCMMNPLPGSAMESLTGEEIAQKAFDRDRGENSFSRATMILENKNGHKRSRTFTLHRMVDDGLESRLLRFTSPADIKGTGFLMIEISSNETERFLYLPALRRSRRIVSSQKHHPFVNSDFTYEDMERHPVEHFEYTLTGEETINGIDGYLLEMKPRESTRSQYSLIKTCISKKSYVTVFAEYFDINGNHIKTYRVSGLEKKQNIWTETKIVMENVITHHKTHIILDDIEYNSDMLPGQISRTALESGGV